MGKGAQWQSVDAMPLHYQFIDKPTLTPDRAYEANAGIGDGERTQASFMTLPEQLGDETRPLRVLLSSCYFTGNKRSRLASSLFSQLDRNGVRPHLRVWAGDQVYLDAPWYEFAIKSHSVAELERMHCATYARTWFAEQGLGSVLPKGANVFCTDDHDAMEQRARSKRSGARHAQARNAGGMVRNGARAWRGRSKAIPQLRSDSRVPPLDFLRSRFASESNREL